VDFGTGMNLEPIRIFHVMQAITHARSGTFDCTHILMVLFSMHGVLFSIRKYLK
jgi:hypothetical protein